MVLHLSKYGGFNWLPVPRLVLLEIPVIENEDRNRGFVESKISEETGFDVADIRRDS